MKEKFEKSVFYHTTAHILAQAVKRLYPGTKLAIGPAVENGFYYDFDCEIPFTGEDLERIEEEMKKIIDSGYEIESFELSREEAISFMKEKEEPYKLELIHDMSMEEKFRFLPAGRIL